MLPRNAHPVVGRFLAFHKHLLPLRGFKTIEAADLHALGVVGARAASRASAAAPSGSRTRARCTATTTARRSPPRGGAAPRAGAAGGAEGADARAASPT